MNFKKEVEKNVVTVKLKSGKDGKAFGSVSSKEIAQEAMNQFGMDIDKKKIQIDEPIKALGNYEIQVRLHPKVTAKLMLQVVEA